MSADFVYERPRCVRCRNPRLMRSYLCADCWAAVTAIPAARWAHDATGKVVMIRADDD